MTCTCPSGDGSLRWPCPVHSHPDAEAVAPLPSARVTITIEAAIPLVFLPQLFEGIRQHTPRGGTLTFHVDDRAPSK